MLLLTLIVFVEKVLPQRQRAATAIALILLGIVGRWGLPRCPRSCTSVKGRRTRSRAEAASLWPT